MSDPKKPSESNDSQLLSKTRHERVGPDEDGQRIDNFLIRQCKGVPRSHIYRIIRKGDVRVDGRRIKQTRKLVAGEQVRIPAIRMAAETETRVPDKLARAAGTSILFEHDDFLLVNKPPGIAVHGGSGLAFGLIDALRQSRNEPKLELAHRLDRATSGCLLVGRGLKANRKLQDLFRHRLVTKRYWAIVDGNWRSAVKRIDAPLMKNQEHAGERRVMVDPSGQQALTYFTILERYKDATLLDIELDTGRTHQIRVHSRHAGHAVIGDSRYGDNGRNAMFKKMGLNRLFLHSRQLAFDWEGQNIKVDADADQQWQHALSTLRS